jgi:hypothetical protein
LQLGPRGSTLQHSASLVEFLPPWEQLPGTPLPPPAVDLLLRGRSKALTALEFAFVHPGVPVDSERDVLLVEVLAARLRPGHIKVRPAREECAVITELAHACPRAAR